MARMVIRSSLVSVSSYGIDTKQISAMFCRRCRSPLDLHQPNPNQPDQFLATCTGCGKWFRVEAKGGEKRATVVQMPEVDEIRGVGINPLYDPASD